MPKKKKNDLARYQDKRDFGRTPEPRGTPARARGRRLTYVIQKHDARRLHYDLRLEHDGVLKSWAVPKEPAADSERRLAARTIVAAARARRAAVEGADPVSPLATMRAELGERPGRYAFPQWSGIVLTVLLIGLVASMVG